MNPKTIPIAKLLFLTIAVIEIAVVISLWRYNNDRTKLSYILTTPTYQDVKIMEYWNMPIGSQSEIYNIRTLKVLIFGLIKEPIITVDGDNLIITEFEWEYLSNWGESDDAISGSFADVNIKIDPDIFIPKTGGSVQNMWYNGINGRLQERYELMLRKKNSWIQNIIFK
jgi:hypothetical protein